MMATMIMVGDDDPGRHDLIRVCCCSQCALQCGMDVELQFEGSERDVGILEFRKWRSLSLPAGLRVRSSCP